MLRLVDFEDILRVKIRTKIRRCLSTFHYNSETHVWIRTRTTIKHRRRHKADPFRKGEKAAGTGEMVTKIETKWSGKRKIRHISGHKSAGKVSRFSFSAPGKYMCMESSQLKNDLEGINRSLPFRLTNLISVWYYFETFFYALVYFDFNALAMGELWFLAEKKWCGSEGRRFSRNFKGCLE